MSLIEDLKTFKDRTGLTNEKIGELFGYSGSHIAAILRGDRHVSEGEADFFAGILDQANKGQWQPIQLNAQDLTKVRQAYAFRKKKECARHFGIEPSHWSKMESGSDDISMLTSCKILLKLKQDGFVSPTLERLAEANGPQQDLHTVIESNTVYGSDADTQAPQQFGRGQFERVMPRMIDGEPLWIVADVCRAIGYSDPHKAVLLAREDDRKKVRASDSLGREQEQWAVNEYGLLRILAKSSVPKAEPFERWVFEEVLPQIRKTGSYSVQQQHYSQPADLSGIIAQVAQMVGFVGRQQQQMQAQFQQQIAETRQLAQASSEVAAERAAQKLQNEALYVGVVKNWLRKTCPGFIYKTLRDRGETRSYPEWIRKEFWPGIHESARVSAFADISTRQQADAAREWLNRYARIHSIILPQLQAPMDFEYTQEARVAQ